MAPTRPTELYQRRVRLVRRPCAAAESRAQVRAALRAWNVPVDHDVAILLTSEVVTNSVTHAAGATIVLAITCGPCELRVDVHDTSRAWPTPVQAPTDAETGRGLMLVSSLADEWGFYRTPDGKAVYFTLGFGTP